MEEPNNRPVMTTVEKELVVGAPVHSNKYGVIVYLNNILEDRTAEGIFSFSFYLRDKGDFPPSIGDEKRPVYWRGICYYRDMINRPDSPFANWRIVIYTDFHSFQLLNEHKEQLNFDEIFLDKKVSFGIVEWPYYYYHTKERQLRRDILRMMRFRAFFDFSHIPVFVRDADTLWALEYDSRKFLDYPPELMYRWETDFLEAARKIRGGEGPAAAGAEGRGVFFFSSDMGYHRDWHKNKRTGRQSPLGAFAGFQNVFPPVSCFQSLDLWNECIEYINKVSVLYSISREQKWSNDEDDDKIGKDEQILLFIILPACRANVFFFELDFFKRRFGNFGLVTPSNQLSPEQKLPGYLPYFKTYQNTKYPSSVLELGSNERLQEVFNLFLAGNNGRAMTKRNRYKSNDLERKQERWSEMQRAVFGRTGGKRRKTHRKKHK